MSDVPKPEGLWMVWDRQRERYLYDAMCSCRAAFVTHEGAIKFIANLPGFPKRKRAQGDRYEVVQVIGGES